MRWRLWIVGAHSGHHHERRQDRANHDGPGFARHPFAIKNIAFTRILMDQGIYVSMLVIAFAITGLFLGSAAWATFDSGVLPRWTGWIAAATTVLCVASLPAM